MADVWNAYTFLNNSLKLGLSQETLNRAEAMFLKEWMAGKNYPADVIETTKASEWEFFLHLQPVKKIAD